MLAQGLVERLVEHRQYPVKHLRQVEADVLEFIGDAGLCGGRLGGLPARGQRQPDPLAVGAALGRGTAAVDVGHQAGHDLAFLVQQHPSHRLGRMGGEDRLDPQARQQRGQFVGAHPVPGEAADHVPQAAGLGTVAGTFVFAAAADAVHPLGQVDRLEVGRERAHQVAGMAGVAVSQGLRKPLDCTAVFAPDDRSPAHAFDLGEELRAALLCEDFAHQRSESLDVFPQQRVGGGKFGLAQRRAVGMILSDWAHVPRLQRATCAPREAVAPHRARHAIVGVQCIVGGSRHDGRRRIADLTRPWGGDTWRGDGLVSWRP